MAIDSTTAPVRQRTSGRGAFWTGLGLGMLAVGLLVAQYALQLLWMPWYVPIMTTLGALLVFVAVARHSSVVRIIVLVLITALAGFEWYFFTSMSRLAPYAGPARAGAQIPAFRTAFADGRPFTEKDLRDGTPRVMTFFRGRW